MSPQSVPVPEMLQRLVSAGVSSPLAMERMVALVGAHRQGLPLSLTAVAPHLWKTASTRQHAEVLSLATEAVSTNEILQWVAA